jgi:hypothetical protein
MQTMHLLYESIPYRFLLISYTHSVGLEPTTSSSTLLKRNEVPFELISIVYSIFYYHMNSFIFSWKNVWICFMHIQRQLCLIFKCLLPFAFCRSPLLRWWMKQLKTFPTGKHYRHLLAPWNWSLLFSANEIFLISPRTINVHKPQVKCFLVRDI